MVYCAYAMTLLSFDYDLSNTSRKTEILFEIHRYLWDIHTRLEGTFALSHEINHKLSMYFEYLSILPEEQRKKITGEGELPLYICGDGNKHSKLQQTISEDLKNFLVSEGIGKKLSELMIDDHFHGLKSRIFPIDMAVKDKSTAEILLFLVLGSERNRYMKRAGGEIRLIRKQLLKEKLYSYHFPSVPLKRIVLNKNRSSNSYIQEILQTIQEVMEKKETNTLDNDSTETNMDKREPDKVLSFQKSFPWVRVNLKSFTG
jgi:hypothetical protein